MPRVCLTPDANSLIEEMEDGSRSLFQTTLSQMLASEEVTSCIRIYGRYRAVVTCFDTQFVIQYVGKHVFVKGHSATPAFVLDTYDQDAPGDLQPPSWLGSFQPLLRTTPLAGLKTHA